MRKAIEGKTLYIISIVSAVIVFVVIILCTIFIKDIFQIKTSINGVDCSFLNIPGTSSKLEKTMNNAEITLLFAEDKKYTCLGAHFKIKISDISSIMNAMSEQKENDVKTYNIQNLYTADEKVVKDYLSSLSVFNEKNVREPENASLKWDDKSKSFYIKPEVYGNKVSLDEAVKYMMTALSNGQTVIDFRNITDINPKILSTDKKLIEQKDSINKTLKTSIKYNLHDGSTYKLDANKMKDWLKQDDEGNYSLDIEGNVPDFVNKLAEKAEYQLASTKFKATGIGMISVAYGRRTYATVDEEAEISRIKEILANPQEVTLDVTYNPIKDYSNLSTYVELDISRQRVWMYVNGRCIVNTPVVTGSVNQGYSTPVGIYYLTYKSMHETLEGYNSDGSKYSSPVTFWMPFNGGIGFHDASWRSNFGGNIYMTNGSHGCVNMPYGAASTLYANINTSIPIIVYAS